MVTVTDALFWISWALAGLVSLPLVFFAIEAGLGIVATRPLPFAGQVPRTCILIPAHNEAEIITDTLAHLAAIIPSGTRLLVVADNCSDETADLARRQGIDVLERHDVVQRGKGYALDFGRTHLAYAPPDCVIVFDADCRSDAQSIAHLATACLTTGQALQARYTFDTDTGLSPKVQISNFALWIKNVVRQRGSARLGGAAILTGTGMAFPWRVFEKLPLATGSIVEDLALSVHLTRTGDAPVYFEQATVLSAAAHEGATLEQRSRWEHGFLGVAKTHGFAALAHGIANLQWRPVILGLHLMVPPLALLLSLATASALMVCGIGWVTGGFTPFFVVIAALSALLLVILINWMIEGRAWLSARALIYVPFYVIWKLPLYGKFLMGKTATWVRTQRS